ncbi:MAG TPA: hypothetical protein VGI19_10925 [Candidatus Cybelea sp.]|jgi:hypothetical protein|nr:hypothetical protein [Candidatus Cybelea sp.]
MKTITTGLVLTVGILFASMLPSVAQSSMSSMPAMPKCAAGDSVVGVNMNTKMYMTKSQMMAKSAGMSQSQKQAMMAKNHVKMMCKSQATAMGAKPMPSM